MRPDHHELTEGLRMAAVAVVSAVLTATVIIGAGRVILQKPQAAVAADRLELIQVAAR